MHPERPGDTPPSARPWSAGLPRGRFDAETDADADAMLVVGGAGGQQQIPDWVANLRTTPEAAVAVGRRRSDVVATELDDEEHDRIWADLVQVWPRIATYHRRAGRRIPVFRLVPTDRESARRPQGM